jgi:hypothetical protein
VLVRVAVTPQDTPHVASATAPASIRAVAGVEAAVARDLIPWWVRAAAQPASVLALGLASVAVAFAPQILGASKDAPQWSAGVLTVLTGMIAPWLGRVGSILGGDPVAGTGVALAIVPLVLVVSTALFRFGASLTTVHFAAPDSRRGRASRDS